ncbi:MAG TPA: DUF1080 domain-containing protein [Humisphaera sp.]|nr:DUF1080 domain-containing protein [Humisphaera sp.]
MLKRVALTAAAVATIGIGTYFARAEDKPAVSIKASVSAAEAPKPDADGFIEMFNGKDLTGWSGYEGYWSAKDGAIVGSEEKAKSKHTFLVYTAIPTIGDFEMHYKYKFGTPTGNSGLQFRSKIYNEKNFSVGGYQADCDGGKGYDGTIYDEHGIAGGRGTMSGRGQKVTWDAENKRHNEPLPETDAQLKGFVKLGDWNDVVLVADGPHMTYTINGHLMTDLTDNSPKEVKEGVIALQIHGGFTMDILFKDLKIKLLKK